MIRLNTGPSPAFFTLVYFQAQKAFRVASISAALNPAATIAALSPACHAKGCAAGAMGCVFTKICEHGASSAARGLSGREAMGSLFSLLIRLIDELDEEQPEGGHLRRLSRTKATLLASFEPSAAPHASTGILLRHHRTLSKPKPLAKHSEDDDGGSNDAIVYGGGIPGVALDAERVDLPEFTGVRDGGYKVR